MNTNPIPSSPDLYTRLRTEDICRIFGVSDQTVCAWRSKRKISFRRDGNTIWYTVSDVLEFEARKLVKSKSDLTPVDLDRFRQIIREAIAAGFEDFLARSQLPSNTVRDES